MEHLSFELICRIADGNISTDESSPLLTHLHICRKCQIEVEMQRSLIKASRQIPLINPSANFTQSVVDNIIPSRRKKWYEKLLHNMGNIIAMASVLAFLGYVYSVTGTSNFQISKPTNTKLFSEFIRIIQDGSHHLVKYLIPNFSIKDTDASQLHIAILGLLAIVILVFIDRIAQNFFRWLKT